MLCWKCCFMSTRVCLILQSYHEMFSAFFLLSVYVFIKWYGVSARWVQFHITTTWLAYHIDMKNTVNQVSISRTCLCWAREMLSIENNTRARPHHIAHQQIQLDYLRINYLFCLVATTQKYRWNSDLPLLGLFLLSFSLSAIPGNRQRKQEHRLHAFRLLEYTPLRL